MSMKVATASVSEQEQWLEPAEFTLQDGLIGFPEARRIELIYNPEELPFMWLRCAEHRALNFIVIEPQAFMSDYDIEISDDDADRLEIAVPDDVFVLNIVTFKPEDPSSATVNLIGPIVVNRRTLAGRQIVIGNFSDYTARHPLIERATADA